MLLKTIDRAIELFVLICDIALYLFVIFLAWFVYNNYQFIGELIQNTF